MPTPSCTAVASWSGVEEEEVEDNSSLAAFNAAKAALEKAEKAADTLMKAFEAQDCPAGKDGCTFKSEVRAVAKVTVSGPERKPGPKHKFAMTWVCAVKYQWSEQIFCYKTKADKDAADKKREDDKKAADKQAEEAAKAAARKGGG